MAMDYAEVSKKILDAVGGAGNVASASHCMTRLRLILNDETKADDEKVKKIKGVKNIVKQGGIYQVVIGNEVSNLFKEFKKLGNFTDDAGTKVEATGNPVQRLFGFVAGCMTPLLPAMLGTGMLKVVLTLLTTFAGMDATSSTYVLIYAVADSFFMFLPIMLGYTIAKKMGGNPTLFMVIGAALCYPDLITLMGGGMSELGTFLGMPCTYMFGLPVICSTYTSSVLPMFLMAPVMKWAEGFADRVSPNVLKAFLKPLLFFVICTPVVLYVLGPIGNTIGTLLSNVFAYMFDNFGWLTVGVLSALMPFIVMTGMHYALIPLFMNNMATLGFDVVVLVTMYCSNLAQGGSSFGVALKTKNVETRSEGIACGVSAVVAGVTEPAMYGINIRYGTPMIAAVIAAGVSGLFCGLTGVRGYTMGGSPSILSLITFIGGDEPMRGVIFGAIAAVIIMVISIVLTMILYKDPVEDAADTAEDKKAVKEKAPAKTLGLSIGAPVSGKVKSISECADEVFSSGSMGKGVMIEPDDNKVYAPCDGKVENLFETMHAICVTSSDGAEVLIHIGMDTVSLNGVGFTAHCKTGDEVKKGQLLLEFDPELIKSKGLSTVTPVVIMNTDDYTDVIGVTGLKQHGDEILTL